MSAIRPRPDKFHNARSDYCTCRTCTRVRAEYIAQREAREARAELVAHVARRSGTCSTHGGRDLAACEHGSSPTTSYVATKSTLLWCSLHNGPDTCNTPNTDDYGV
jgi:hypothetical protein